MIDILIKYKKESGRSSKWIAQKLEWNTAKLSRILNKKQEPTHSELVQLFEVLGFSVKVEILPLPN